MLHLRTINPNLTGIFSSRLPELFTVVERGVKNKPWPIGPKIPGRFDGLQSNEWRRLRGKKIAKVDLPDIESMRDRDPTKMTPDEIRAKLKEKGVVPLRSWNERPIVITCTPNIVESYVPPEGDGKASLLSKEGAKQMMQKQNENRKYYLSLRKIRSYLPDFDVPSFANEALDIYIQAHQALVDDDEDKLHELVTEFCYPQMVHHCDLKTVRWQFIKSLEPPRVVHLRHQPLIQETNMFAQATVRFHTQQILAIYDRFGRLMYGSEALVKDVLEYVVFEHHVADFYGKWRIHGKIIPDWLPRASPIEKTFKKPSNVPGDEPEPEKSTDKTVVTTAESESDPKLATA